MSHLEPSWAERARTALAGSTTATLLTRGCRSSRTLTPVSMADADEGRPSFWLDERSPLLRVLGSGRVGTLSVPALAPYRSVELTGPLASRPSSRPGLRAFRIAPLSVRLVGTVTRSVPVADFVAAQPDPLRSHAAAVLRHLEQAHASALLACVHAHGLRDVRAVVPHALDRYGITLVTLGPEGVRSLRLRFPDGPVDRLEDVTAGLRAQLTCRCRQHRRS